MRVELDKIERLAIVEGAIDSRFIMVRIGVENGRAWGMMTVEAARAAIVEMSRALDAIDRVAAARRGPAPAASDGIAPIDSTAGTGQTPAPSRLATRLEDAATLLGAYYAIDAKAAGLVSAYVVDAMNAIEECRAIVASDQQAPTTRPAPAAKEQTNG